MIKGFHICTDKTMRAGIDLPPMICGFCGKKTFYPGWVSIHCDTCGADSERYRSDNCRIVRESMGLTRNQVAKALGYTRKTVKKYEWCDPSNIYWYKFKAFVADFYNQHPTPQIGDL